VGGTVNVLEGTYSEEVTVNKSLTILGAQHGVSAVTGRPGAAESVLDASGNGGVTLFDVAANDVTIDGFTVENATSTNDLGYGIVLGAGTHGSHVLNNIIENNIAGLSLANNSGTDQTVIQFNLFQNNNQPGSVSGTAIYTDQFAAGGALTDVLIDSNAFANNSNAGVLLGATTAVTQSDITISANTFTTEGNAVFVGDATGTTIYRNTITDSVASQIAVVGGVNGLSIMQNFIDNGASNGVRILNDTTDGFVAGNQNITLTSNHIQGNPTAGLNLAAGAYTGTLDATNNWWGSPTGPTTPRNPGGRGDAIIDPDGVVQFVPFLTNGADSQPNTPGFQPFPNLPPPLPPPLPPGAPALFAVTVGTSHNAELAIALIDPNVEAHFGFIFWGDGTFQVVSLDADHGGFFLVPHHYAHNRRHVTINLFAFDPNPLAFSNIVTIPYTIRGTT
jgi:hypothetical protein